MLAPRMALGINHGGARPGAGRPKGSKNEPQVELPADWDPFSTEPVPDSPKVSYNTARAEVERIKALNAELHFRIKLGQYVEREKVRQASATAVASFTQAMRSMQDDLERKLDLAPEVVEKIGEYVDHHLEQLANWLEVLGGTKDDLPQG